MRALETEESRAAASDRFFALVSPSFARVAATRPSRSGDSPPHCAGETVDKTRRQPSRGAARAISAGGTERAPQTARHQCAASARARSAWAQPRTVRSRSCSGRQQNGEPRAMPGDGEGRHRDSRSPRLALSATRSQRGSPAARWRPTGAGGRVRSSWLTTRWRMSHTRNPSAATPPTTMRGKVHALPRRRRRPGTPRAPPRRAGSRRARWPSRLPRAAGLASSSSSSSSSSRVDAGSGRFSLSFRTWRGMESGGGSSTRGEDSACGSGARAWSGMGDSGGGKGPAARAEAAQDGGGDGAPNGAAGGANGAEGGANDAAGGANGAAGGAPSS